MHVYFFKLHCHGGNLSNNTNIVYMFTCTNVSDQVSLSTSLFFFLSIQLPLSGTGHFLGSSSSFSLRQYQQKKNTLSPLLLYVSQKNLFSEESRYVLQSKPHVSPITMTSFSPDRTQHWPNKELTREQSIKLQISPHTIDLSSSPNLLNKCQILISIWNLFI